MYKLREMTAEEYEWAKRQIPFEERRIGSNEYVGVFVATVFSYWILFLLIPYDNPIRVLLSLLGATGTGLWLLLSELRNIRRARPYYMERHNRIQTAVESKKVEVLSVTIQAVSIFETGDANGNDHVFIKLDDEHMVWINTCDLVETGGTDLPLREKLTIERVPGTEIILNIESSGEIIPENRIDDPIVIKRVVDDLEELDWKIFDVIHYNWNKLWGSKSA